MQTQYIEEIKKSIDESNMIVVGLGEEWNLSPDTQKSEQYQRIMNDLKENPGYQWLLPYFYYKWTDDKLKQAYKNLFQMLEGKNYYVVATTVNRCFVPFVREGYWVMPCGTEEFLCDEALSASVDFKEFVDSLDAYLNGNISLDEISFVKDETGEVIPFNSVYSNKYKEEGYLSQWSKYMRWLQGTMNRKVCLLELGVGLQFPSVIRFPFEKMAYFNQKATCFRVHKNLYQLAEEMAARSTSVPMHAVELFGEI
jgi:hypothetical protein